MNEQYFEEHFNTSDNVEVNEKSTDEPVNDVANEFPMYSTHHQDIPANQTIPPASPVATIGGSSPALLNLLETERFRARWDEIQGKFVDEPRLAVQQADALVSEVIEQITRMFANEHSTLEGQWNQGSDVSTEDLRVAFQHYRSFFNRLVV